MDHCLRTTDHVRAQWAEHVPRRGLRPTATTPHGRRRKRISVTGECSVPQRSAQPAQGRFEAATTTGARFTATPTPTGTTRSPAASWASRPSGRSGRSRPISPTARGGADFPFLPAERILVEDGRAAESRLPTPTPTAAPPRSPFRAHAKASSLPAARSSPRGLLRALGSAARSGDHLGCIRPQLVFVLRRRAPEPVGGGRRRAGLSHEFADLDEGTGSCSSVRSTPPV